MAKPPPPRKSETVRRSTAPGEALPLRALAERVRGLHVSEDQLIEQRNSFAIGSATLSNSKLTRSSIAEVSSLPEREFSSEPNDTTAIEAANYGNQYDFILSRIKQFLASPSQTFDLTPDLIKEIHKVCLDRLSDSAGQFRSGTVLVSNSTFAAPPAARIPQLVLELRDYVNQNWTVSSALHLSAYVLWRLLWIHPFMDGNGRVARGASYLVLSARLGTLLPGTPTLPELIAQNRSEYYSALEAADEAERNGRTDVTAVESLIGRLLTRQLQNLAFLPASTKIQLDRIIGSRIMRSSEAMRRASFGTTEIRYRLWSQGPYLLLHVGDDKDIQAACDRQISHGDPFPGLFSTQKNSATKALDAKQAVHLFQDLIMDVSRKRAFYLEPDTALALIAPSFRGGSTNYRIAGALYCLRLGPRTTVENCDEIFGLLIARHMRASS